MNLFILADDPMEAAVYHMDTHVNSQLKEACQMLATIILQKGIAPAPTKKNGEPYRATHPNHPCTKWVGTTRRNFDWTLCYADGLVRQYYQRYGQFKREPTHHACREVVEYCKGLRRTIENGPLLPYAIATDLPVMPGESAVDHYRRYYVTSKRHLARWRNGEPAWYGDLTKKLGLKV